MRSYAAVNLGNPTCISFILCPVIIMCSYVVKCNYSAKLGNGRIDTECSNV